MFGDNSEPISMGVVINFAEGTVTGFTMPGIAGYPVKIMERMSSETVVAFGGDDSVSGSKWDTVGNIDRVTGDVDAQTTLEDTDRHKIINKTTYSLHCRPAERLW
jgi:hypothetical protein